MESASVQSAFQTIPLDKIQPSQHQARKAFNEDAIQGLAESMRQEGLLQPITVRQVANSDPAIYELVSGERRLRAAKLLDWKTIEAKVIQTVSEGEAAAKGLIENIQREDLNPIEEAEGFNELSRLDPVYWTQDRMVQVCGKSKSYISQCLALLGLPDEVKASVSTWKLSRSHAEALLPISDKNRQIAFAKDIAKGDWSVRETERRIKDALKVDSDKSKQVQKDKLATKSAADPLSDLWLEFMNDPKIATPLSWQVTYGKQKLSDGNPIPMVGWGFFVTTPGMAPKAELARWFRNMADAFGDTSQEEARVKAVEERMTPTAPEQVKRLEQDQKNMRLPQTPEERSELESLANQSPAAVYNWIYGPQSQFTQAIQGQSWTDLGFADPVLGLTELLAALKLVRAPADRLTDRS